MKYNSYLTMDFYANAIVFVATNLPCVNLAGLFSIALLYNAIWLFNLSLFHVIYTRLLISILGSLLLAEIVDGDSANA